MLRLTWWSWIRNIQPQCLSLTQYYNNHENYLCSDLLKCPRIHSLLWPETILKHWLNNILWFLWIIMILLKDSKSYVKIVWPQQTKSELFWIIMVSWYRWGFGVILTVTLMFSVNTVCVPGCCQVWVVGNSPSAPLLKALEEVLPVIFTLFCFTKQNVSHLR